MLNRWAVLVLVLGLGGFGVADASAQERNFRVLAGASPAGNEDGTGGAARFNAPTGIAVNGAGTLYVADSQNCLIRATTLAGVVTTFAGGFDNSGDNPCGSANGTGTAAQFGTPQGIAVDSAGTLYVADTFNHTIRKITPGGVVTTLAGLAFNSGNTDGTGSAARFNSPRGVAVDAAGNVFVGDTNNHTIRMVTPGGVVTTVAGLAGSTGSTDGTGNVARFNQPRGIAVDATGVLYVADTGNHTIRKITAGGVVTTLAGLAGTTGNAEGTGSAARFNNPRGVAVNSAGTMLYVADTNNNRIRQVTLPGAVMTTLSGSGFSGGYDGIFNAARFNGPEGVTVDAAGTHVYVADTISDTIRIIGIAGSVTTLAGFYGSLGAVDGFAEAARLATPNGAAIDASGNLYVPDRTSNTIRKITQQGNVTTFAGLTDAFGSADGTGSAARFSGPQAIAASGAGTVYVADTNNHTIRAITPGGVVTTLAGLAGSSGNTDGTGSAARFNFPRGVAVDSTGNVYVSDTNSHTIRKIAPGGIVTTLAGLAGSSGSTNGTGSTARFNRPGGVAVDAGGTLYVTDTGNNTIRQVTAGGVVTTLAGTAGQFGSTDGTGSAARFGGPNAITVDSAGTLYVADGQSTIRKITAGAVVTTIAGCPGCIGGENWGRFNVPLGIAVSAKGDLYVADTRNNTIQTTAPLPASLVVDFGPTYGLWVRRGTSEWSQLNPNSSEGFLTIHDNNQHDILIIDFGPGVGLWVWGREDGDFFWQQLSPQSPTEMAGLDFDGDGSTDYGVFSFPGQGLWVFGGNNNDWFQLHPYDASHLATADLDADGGEDLIIDFPGNGLWVYYPAADTWAQLHSLDVSALVTADVDGNGSKDLLMDFPGYGLWTYRVGTGWAQVHPFDATHLAAGDLDGNGVTDLIIDFGAAYGVWVLQNDTTWWQLHTLTSDGITTGDVDGNGHDEVILDFGGVGIWSYEDVGGWHQVHALNPRAIATGRFF